MQCATCQHIVDPQTEGEDLEACPACGALLAAAAMPMTEAAPVAVVPQAQVATSAQTKATKANSKRTIGGLRGTLNRMLGIFLFVGAITIAVGSTMVATRAIKRRDQLQESLAVTTKAFDDTVLAAANSSRLKGAPNAQARQEIFAPAIKGYQEILESTNGDPERLDMAAAASYYLAGLQAKIGAGACVSSLGSGMEAVRKMMEAGYDIDRYPSLNESALKMTAPTDWVFVKDAKTEAHIAGLLFTFTQAIGTLQDLATKNPQATVFRNDLAGMLRISGTLQAMAPDRATFALNAWIQARDVLETLVRDEPSNADFQARLVEALVGAANLQRRDGQTDKAIANYERAVELRQQMVDAHPDDKALADELAKVKSSLEKLRPAGDTGKSASAAAATAVQ